MYPTGPAYSKRWPSGLGSNVTWKGKSNGACSRAVPHTSDPISAAVNRERTVSSFLMSITLADQGPRGQTDLLLLRTCDPPNGCSKIGGERVFQMGLSFLAKGLLGRTNGGNGA